MVDLKQALILVGGKGTRLGEATRHTPKPLMPIAGEATFLDYLVENIARHGLQEIILLAGHMSEQFVQRYQGKIVRGAKIEVVTEPAPAGTGGALHYVRDRLDDVFLMSNGDSILDMNYLALAQAMSQRDDGVLALRRVPNAARYGRIDLADDRITAFHEKDESWTREALISGGVYLLRKSVLDRVKSTPCSIETEIFPALAAEGRLKGKTFDGFFLDIGLPETLAEGRKTLPSQFRRGAAFFDRDGTLNRDPGYVHKPQDLEWLPGAIETIRACNDAGLLVIVITNQAGVARGLYGEDAVCTFHAHMNAQLREHGAHIDDFYFCPHHEAGKNDEYRFGAHPDRKPNAGLIKRAMLTWPIDPTRSFMVGDRPLDIEAGERAGLKAVLVAEGELSRTVAPLLNVKKSDESANFSALKQRAAKASAWLFDQALPLWFTSGFDRKTQTFNERLAMDGSVPAMPRRVRVQARQTFSYAMAGKLGWSGPWREAVEAGAKVLVERGLHPEGGTIYALDASGAPADMRRDLYDAAFVAFGLAHAAMALERKDLAAHAASVADWVFVNWSHPEGGLREGDITPTPPRRQNPHMHMLEACLALYAATGEAKHLERASALGTLFATKFFDERYGALPEYFDDAWRRARGDEGRITEPGHQFEWSWLLDQLRKAGGPDFTAQASRIYTHGEVYGVDDAGVTVNEVWIEGPVRSATSRFWPHTERIKANAARVERWRDPRAAEAAVQAFDVLMTYCATPLPGAWRDMRNADGSFVDEPAPASSLYHATLAIAELIRVTDLV